jgi:hypothetical protein
MSEKCYPHWRMADFVQYAWPIIYTKLLQPEKKRRWSFAGKFGYSTVRIYEMASRVLVTFERDKGKQSVTYITHDKDAVGEAFGLQGYDGNYWEHSGAIDDITRTFRNIANPEKLFKYNSKQSIG